MGVALPFSIAAAPGAGSRAAAMIAHAFRRALILVVLGIFLRSLGHAADPLHLRGHAHADRPRLRLPLPARPAARAATSGSPSAVILVGFWAAFALYPVARRPASPGRRSACRRTGRTCMTGFAAHWNKNENLSAQFDRWFLNLFPREEPFVFNGGGYPTLSFIPTLGTMILGLLAGGVLRSERTAAAEAPAGSLTAGRRGPRGRLAPRARSASARWSSASGRRAWSSSAAAGASCSPPASTAVMDVRGRVRWAFPLIVLGMNSIAAYCMNWVLVEPAAEALVRHLGRAPFLVLGPAFESTLVGAAALLVTWLILHWMHRRKIFIRI